MKTWCIQVAKAFFDEFKLQLNAFEPSQFDSLGDDFWIVTFAQDIEPGRWLSQPLVRYAFPVEYRWPVSTSSEDFIERSSQGLYKKFSERDIVNIQTFSIEQGLKDRAKNFRGRLLQVFQDKLTEKTTGRFATWRQDPLVAPPDQLFLVVVLRAKEVLAGCVVPRDAGSHFAGGRRFLTGGVSRAGAKFVEAAELYMLHGEHLPTRATVLELGAAPGGMTSQIAKLGHHVIAVDRAVLAPEVLKLPNVKFIRTEASQLALNHQVDLIVCDMNGSFESTLSVVLHAARFLKSGGALFFTLKLGNETQATHILDQVRTTFLNQGFALVSAKHLYHNRHELTLVLKKEPS